VHSEAVLKRFSSSPQPTCSDAAVQAAMAQFLFTAACFADVTASLTVMRMLRSAHHNCSDGAFGGSPAAFDQAWQLLQASCHWDAAPHHSLVLGA
jgi:hypothetical protein